MFLLCIILPNIRYEILLSLIAFHNFSEVNRNMFVDKPCSLNVHFCHWVRNRFVMNDRIEYSSSSEGVLRYGYNFPSNLDSW